MKKKLKKNENKILDIASYNSLYFSIFYFSQQGNYVFSPIAVAHVQLCSEGRIFKVGS